MKYIAAFISSLLLSQAASAANFSLDLSSYGLGKVNNINFVDITGGSLINQQTTLGVVKVGNSFTQDALYQVTNFKDNATQVISSNLNTTYEIFMRQIGLAGEVTALTAKGYEYAFTPYAGLIEIFLDTNLTKGHKGILDLGASFKLAELEVIAPSAGSVKGAVKVGTNGDVNLAMDFTWTAPDIWLSTKGDDLASNDSLLAFTNQDGSIVKTKKVGNTLQLSTSQNGIAGVNYILDVNEPASMSFLMLGALGLVLRRRR